MRNKSKRMSLGGKIAIIIAAVVVVAGVAGWAIVNGKLNKIGKLDDGNIVAPVNTIPDEKDEHNGGEDIDANEAGNKIDTSDIKVVEDKDILNILFIGSDARNPGERSRSDSMIICSLNQKTKEIKLVSLMRDMYVQIPGYQNNRINAAYAFGGKSLLNETIEKNFGVKIDGNVAVNFDSFVEALTQIGNLDIELNAAEAKYINSNYGNGRDPEYKNEKWDLKEGVNSLTPLQTLAFARLRYVGKSDWERTDRQRRVIMAAFAKVKDLSVKQALALADKIFPCIATDMDNSMLIKLVSFVFTNKVQIVENARIPLDGTYGYAMIDGKMSVMLPDLKKNSEALHDILYGTSQTADSNSNAAQGN